MLRVLALSLVLVLAPSRAAAQAATDAMAEPGLFERVAVVGASVSDGYGLHEELEVNVDLSVFVEGMLGGKKTVACESNQMFFQRRDKVGPVMIQRIVKAEPTLVLAIDFLFWYGYGTIRGGHEARLARFQRGLELLERLDCPIVVGDFPDVTAALRGEGLFGRPMVSKNQIPTDATRKALNEALHAWAKRRGNVAVVPMGKFLGRLHKGEEMTLRGNEVPADSVRTMLQPDLLHPTVEGTIALMILAFDSVVKTLDAPDEDAVRWDAAGIRAAVMKATEAARQKKREQRERREERRRGKKKKVGEDKDQGGFVLDAPRRLSA